MTDFILSIDQGTTSSRAILFNIDGGIAKVAQREFTQHFPNNGWVEHEPLELWNSVLDTCREVLEWSRQNNGAVKAIGITNQRETTLVWDRVSSQPLYRAIVWQDRRTSDYCDELKALNIEEEITLKTGLLIDPYFSATKVRWILENVEGAREKAEKGQLAFGTVDSYLLWMLTKGNAHKTDATNASRTMLFNIRTQQWDTGLLEQFGIPESMLPEVCDSAANFGTTSEELLGESIPVLGIAGDQQAAMVGQTCFQPGMA